MTEHSSKKQEYRIPLTEMSTFPPGMLCQSLVEGGLEDLAEEEWTL